MRFYNHKLLKDMCDSFNEAVTYAAKSSDSSILKTCVELLCAIQNNLEVNKKSLKSNKAFDIIMSMSNELIDIMNDSGKSVENVIVLSKQLSDTISTDVNCRLRVLFVAELGGKWDSMASVYEEFIKRDDCDVDVVIEPIFRVINLPDGSKKSEMVYEDFLSPMGIKHILYDKYDMSKIMPDITFFSQPYESVTIPMFWPENMAKYTRVVYLPYYAAQALASWSVNKHIFFKADTEKYSWRIACQSERMKKYYQLYASNKGKNVIASGLPKFDFVVNLPKKNLQCPEEWKKKLTGRKVFLWNTHFTIGGSATNILGDISNFLEIFEGSEDKALIWRPHPMTETIVKLYCPDKYIDYLRLKEHIDRSENMLIDKNIDYSYSFEFSDAMISDFSSMMDQYMLTGKPVILTANKPKEEKNKVFYTIDKLHSFLKMPISCSDDDTKKFIDDICAGNDSWKESRKQILEECFSLADGKAGERLTQTLINDFYNEIGIRSDKQKKSIENVVIIGKYEDSLPCLKQMENKNIKCFICDDMLPYCDYSEGYNKVSCYDLDKIDFDCVIVTEKEYCEKVCEVLVKEHDISEDIIIPFWKMYYISLPALVCDKVLMNPKVSSYNGLILGISHTEVGIIAEKMKKPFCNLAVSSQDLYYQLRTLEYCLKTYPEKFKDLEYAVIDLCDYKYFNYDTSSSNSAVKYLIFGGYDKDPHNFADNKNYRISYEEAKEAVVMRKYEGINNNVINICNELFKGIYQHADYEGFEPNFDINTRFRTVTDSDIDEYTYDDDSTIKVFESTITENVECLKSIFETLLSFNENIKIYTVLIPKYIEVEIRQTEQVSKFIDRFNNEMKLLSEKYKYTMIDFNKTDLSLRRTYYYDAAHLNYFGARWVTEQLNKIIFDNE